MATDLVTTSSIRAVLGVSEKELRDDVLIDTIYATLLQEDLLQLHASIITDYELAYAEDPRTELEQRFVDMMQTYSAYQVASQCFGSVAMFAPVTIKDSRSELTRTADPHAQLKENILASLVLLRKRLRAVYLLVNPAATIPVTTARTMVTAAPLGTNPVTG